MRSNGDMTPCEDFSDYCGGNFKGIKENVDYIQGMGFDAIWISPIVENLEKGYHGYWATNFYTINPNFGSEKEFKELVEELHRRGMWIMVDIVVNHVAPIEFDFKQITPFNNEEHYHDYCTIDEGDWGNPQILENCRLDSLPDLKQENVFVEETLLKWINDLVSKYELDGLRIDTALMVPKWFWKKFQEAAGVFATGEVFNFDMDLVADYQNYLDSLLNYPLRGTLVQVWKQQVGFKDLHKRLKEQKIKYKDPSVLTVFVDNHDNERFLHENGNRKAFQSALIFNLFVEGIPIIYYGSEQFFGGGNDPFNREPLWTNLDVTSPNYNFISLAVKTRKKYEIWNKEMEFLTVEDNFFAFKKGSVVVVQTNHAKDISRLVTGLKELEGMRLCNIFDQRDCIVITEGSCWVRIRDFCSKVYTPSNDLKEVEV